MLRHSHMSTCSRPEVPGEQGVQEVLSSLRHLLVSFSVGCPLSTACSDSRTLVIEVEGSGPDACEGFSATTPAPSSRICAARRCQGPLPFGFSEREEPISFQARVCHREQHRRVAFPSTSGRDARGHLTPRPLCDRGVPSAPEESKRLGIPCMRRQGGRSSRWGVCTSCPQGWGGPSSTRPDTRRAATPPCTPCSTLYA